jgi:riboflavin kinase/FMN adenylyltransferase
VRILRHPRGAPGTALAVGSFDGVHRGHQAVVERVRERAAAGGWQGAVVTFEPQPREFFTPAEAPGRLTSLAEKLALLAAADLDIAFVERFDAAFAALDAAAFEAALRDRYGARHVVVGHDFRYGARRMGDVERLERAGARLGFGVEVLPPIADGAARISSTRIRAALAAGDFATARGLLGRPYAITGHVVHGEKRGRLLGFPTANVRLGRPKPALAGIYAVKCYGAATRGLEGVASLGSNPAVRSGGPASLEAYLFDFSGDLYGARLSVEFVKKLRDEAHFASLDELAAQIARDCEAARELFRNR